MFLQPLLPSPVTLGSVHEVLHLDTQVLIPVLLSNGDKEHMTHFHL